MKKNTSRLFRILIIAVLLASISLPFQHFNVRATNYCSGGTETTIGAYSYNTFTSSGTFNCASSVYGDILVVAGGGGGGGEKGGGGGGGGVIFSSNYFFTTGNKNVTVGAGGAGGSGSNGQEWPKLHLRDLDRRWRWRWWKNNCSWIKWRFWRRRRFLQLKLKAAGQAQPIRVMMEVRIAAQVPGRPGAAAAQAQSAMAGAALIQAMGGSVSYQT